MTAELSDRQKVILSLVIHEYSRSAQPVGSKTLVEHYHLDFSPATIRNELSALDEMGYLRQPHTSAGRVPTEEGYRFFVGRLLQDTELPDTTQETISHQFFQMRSDVDQWARLAASILAIQSRSASLVTAPHPEAARLKHIELVATRGRQVLMVVVLLGGEVRQRFLTLSEPVSQEQLSQAAHALTSQLTGRGADALRALQPDLDALQLEVAPFLMEELMAADALGAGEVYFDGLTNMLSAPEFAGSEDARRALRLLEEKPILQDLLSRTLATADIGGVQVLIGGEGDVEELSNFSLVLSRYGAAGLATGTLGVLGSMRMQYGRTIPLVRYLSRLMSEMVTTSLSEDEF